MLTPCPKPIELLKNTMGDLLTVYLDTLDKYEVCMLRHGAMVGWAESN